MDVFNPYAGTDFGNGGSMAVNLLSGGRPQSSIYNVMQRYGNIGDTATQPPPMPAGANASGYAGWGSLPDHGPVSSPAGMGGAIPMPGLTPHVKKPGMFGRGGTGWGILGILGDALSASAGGPARFTEMVGKQREQEMEQQIAEQRWRAEQQWKRDNPEPTAIERNKAFFDRFDPTGDLGTSYVNSEANPMAAMEVTAPDGTRSLRFYPKGNPGALGGQGGPVQVNSEEEVARLPVGAQFIAPDGSVRTKHGGAGQGGPQTFR